MRSPRFLFCVAALAAIPFSSLAQEKEVRGAPLNPPKKEIQGAPLATDPAAPPAPGAPLRNIPKAAFDALAELEKTTDDPLAFEKTKDGKYLKATFRGIGGFDYLEPDPKELRAAKDPKTVLDGKIPAAVKALDGKAAVLVGFMVPIDVNKDGDVTAFALTQNQSFCCYGIPPAINQLIMVNMEDGKAAPYAYDTPVAVYGALHVGEDIEDGYILSVYRMTATEVIDVVDFQKKESDGV